MKQVKKTFILVLILGFFVSPALVLADGTRAEAKLRSLDAVANLLHKKEKQLATVQAESSGSSHVSQQIERLRQEQDRLKTNFIEIASGLDLSALTETKEEKSFDLLAEVKSLLNPLIREVQRFTERPRQIDAYKTEVEKLEERVTLQERAIARVEALLKLAEGATLEQLLETKQYWLQRVEVSSTNLKVAQEKLATLEAARVSMFDSTEQLLTRFFRSKGRNLLIAFVSTLLFWFLARQVYGRILGTEYFASPAHISQARLIHVCYYLFSGFGSFFVFLFVLFLFGDWILLFFGCVFLLGVGWTSKAALPKIWTQIGLLLNFGPVREGERVEYRGLPFLVDRIAFHSYLLNPALTDGKLRLPIADLERLRSRPVSSEEPWFTTSGQDWVLLSGDSVGQIENQSIDFVTVRLRGGARRVFPTLEFLRQQVVRLNNGFRLMVSVTVIDSEAAEIDSLVANLKKSADQSIDQRDVHISVPLVALDSVTAAGIVLVFHFDCEGSEGSRYDEVSSMVKEVVHHCLRSNQVPVASDLLRVNVVENGAK